MKTSFKKINGRWIVPTNKLVFGYNCVIGQEAFDPCSGEHLCIVADEFGPEPCIEILHFEENFETGIIGKTNKKVRRKQRVDEMCEIHWDFKTCLKKIGKNRRLRRRMWPNEEQWKNYNGYLPLY